MSTNDDQFSLLMFPRSLPNDLEGLIWYYPAKFPPIVEYYEEVAPKLAFDAEAFREYGLWAREELGQAFEIVKNDYEKGDQSSLDFLVETDERFQKMYCYRFWIINYIFPDGPIHDYFVTSLKSYIRKILDVGESVEDFEQRVEKVQRDLMQGDYADLYLQQALSGVTVYNQLNENPELSKFLSAATELIDNHNKADSSKINEIWEEVRQKVLNDPSAKDLKKSLSLPLEQTEMRGSNQPFYNMLTHTVEFREENLNLASRHKNMRPIIEEYKATAREKLTEEEFKEFELAYTQAQNFTEFKDIMGSIDTVLLPLWFGLHSKIRETLLSNNPKMIDRPTGPPAVHQHFVWYLPEELKSKVMTPDFEPFKLEEI